MRPALPSDAGGSETAIAFMALRSPCVALPTVTHGAPNFMQAIARRAIGAAERMRAHILNFQKAIEGFGTGLKADIRVQAAPAA